MKCISGILDEIRSNYFIGLSDVSYLAYADDLPLLCKNKQGLLFMVSKVMMWVIDKLLLLLKDPITHSKDKDTSIFTFSKISHSNNVHRIWSGFKTRALKHKILLNVKFH